ncbi:MAG: hypothetical protein U1D55_01255 [Phycisphaerae bacterium]
MSHRTSRLCAPVLASLAIGPSALAALVDFNFTISYSGNYISGRLVGLNVDVDGNATEIDPARVLLYHVPTIVGLSASPSQPYVFVPYTFERSTYFSGTFVSTTPNVYGFQVSNYTISPAQQNLLMMDAGADVTLVFNFGASAGYQGGVATYGIMGEEDALWPAVNTSVSFSIVSIPCPADLNGDHAIDSADLGILLSGYGCSGGVCPGDINGDQSVDSSDLGILLSKYGTGCP